ncbi:hypothetical protein EOD39_12968 [Acipenser ruthenus]|uniref:Uncharacterized protein n=1 Tax=Acipenser ruthenus TaxID=7906 RepID=A0A662YQ00_ACIRT|nr:hypothetical protein EOD39_12968 [Acipenser ruthenus]
MQQSLLCHLRPSRRLNPTLAGLLRTARQFMSEALAPSTRSASCSTFLLFSNQNRISYSVFNLDHFLAFITYLQVSLNLLPSSIRSYVSGIQHQFHLLSISAPQLLPVPAIRLTLRGMERTLMETAAPSRLTISLDILRLLISMLMNGCFNLSDDFTMAVLCLCAFISFRRCLEFSVPSPTSFLALGLRHSNLSQVPGCHLILLLRSSKMDQLHRGPVGIQRVPGPHFGADGGQFYGEDLSRSFLFQVRVPFCPPGVAGSPYFHASCRDGSSAEGGGFPLSMFSVSNHTGDHLSPTFHNRSSS